MQLRSKKSYFAFIAATTGAGLIIGAACGLVAGGYMLRSIAGAETAQGDSACGTGLVVIGIISVVIGSILGVVLGGISGLTAALIIRARRNSQRKSDWAAYYGK